MSYVRLKLGSQHESGHVHKNLNKNWALTQNLQFDSYNTEYFRTCFRNRCFFWSYLITAPNLNKVSGHFASHFLPALFEKLPQNKRNPPRRVIIRGTCVTQEGSIIITL